MFSSKKVTFFAGLLLLQLSMVNAFDLGGGKIQVLCAPKQVARNKDVIVNVRYRMDIPRESDIYVDVLNADTKEFYAGQTTEVDAQAGELTARFTLPEHAEEPFIWKVFVTPRGEPFPNMIAETGMAIGMDLEDPKVIGQCKPIETKGWTPKKLAPVDYLTFTEKQDLIVPGETAELEVKYGLISAEEGSINFSLMTKWSNEWAGVSQSIPVVEGEDTARVTLQIPEDIDLTKEYYIIAFLGEIDATWEDKLSEERYYNLEVEGYTGPIEEEEEEEMEVEEEEMEVEEEEEMEVEEEEEMEEVEEIVVEPVKKENLKKKQKNVKHTTDRKIRGRV